MNSDIRISTAIFSNRKIRRLRRQRGDSGIVSLFKIWIDTALHNPTGLLKGMTKEDLMDVAETNDETFVDLLVELGLLEWDGITYRIHHWHHHNHWAMGAEKRSEKARKAVQKRWNLVKNPDSENRG